MKPYGFRPFYRHAFAIELANAPGAPELPNSIADVEARFDQAWGVRDLATTVAAGRALLSRRSIDDKRATRFVRSLVHLGRHAEALEVARELGVNNDDVLLASAAQSSTEDAFALLALLSESGGYAAVGDLVSSPEAELLEESVELALRHNLVVVASRLVADAVEAGWASDDERRIRCLAAAQAVFRAATPEQTAWLLERLEGLFPDESDNALRQAALLALPGGLLPLEALGASEDEDLQYEQRLTLATAAMGAGNWRLAIGWLGKLCIRNRRDGEFRANLARSVGQLSTTMYKLGFTPPALRPRIIDVFLFNGELDMLDIKLREMSSWVDRFVIVEARETFTSTPKPLHFENNKSRFAEFHDKIIHVVAETPPSSIDTAWAREFFQRDSGLRGLDGICSPDDWVIVSDVDEIVSPHVVTALEGEYAVCAVRTFNYFLNFEIVGRPRPDYKISLIKAKYLASVGLSYARHGVASYNKRRIANGGWHFSSVMTPAEIKSKLDSYSHEEWSGRAESVFAKLIEKIHSGEVMEGFRKVDIDETYPLYVRENQARLRHLIL